MPTATTTPARPAAPGEVSRRVAATATALDGLTKAQRQMVATVYANAVKEDAFSVKISMSLKGHLDCTTYRHNPHLTCVATDADQHTDPTDGAEPAAPAPAPAPAVRTQKWQLPKKHARVDSAAARNFGSRVHMVHLPAAKAEPAAAPAAQPHTTPPLARSRPPTRHKTAKNALSATSDGAARTSKDSGKRQAVRKEAVDISMGSRSRSRSPWSSDPDESGMNTASEAEEPSPPSERRPPPTPPPTTTPPKPDPMAVRPRMVKADWTHRSADWPKVDWKAL